MVHKTVRHFLLCFRGGDLSADDHEVGDTHAELEENEEDLNKLNSWFAKILARDCLGAKNRDTAESALQDCATAFDGFANVVHVAERSAIASA